MFGKFPSHHKRWMSFVDGENLTIRGQAFADANDLNLGVGDYCHEDVFVWFPTFSPTDVIKHEGGFGAYSEQTRSYYYTSMVGDESAIEECRKRLWKIGFHPEVFKKDKQSQKSKGVDITLAKDFLSHAFLNNYDAAFLFAGDGDYEPLLEEVKRMGKVVGVCFFENEGLSSRLKLAADFFFPVDEAFRYCWRAEEKIQS